MKKSVKILIIVLCLIIVGLVTVIVVDKVMNNNKDSNANENNTSIVKSNTSDSVNSNEKNSTNETEVAEGNRTTNSISNNSEKEIANEAIREALKDKAWLQENISSKKSEAPVYVDEHDGDENYIEEFTFAKLDNEKYVVYDDQFQLVIVSFENGKVVTSKKSIYSYYSLRIDLNEGIVKVDDIDDSQYGPAEMLPYLYEIDGIQFKPILNYEISSDGINYVYYYKGVECTEEEYSKYVSQYKQGYNYVSIDTKLTDENIDKYVK